jgi:two-component system, cell cycle sensor histidine kinase and response regulator CckA
MTATAMRVVIIDDNPDDRAEVKAALRNGSMRRYELHEAPTGEHGLELIRALREKGESPDCVVVDVHLPGMDVFEILAALPRDEMGATTPIVVITGDLRFERCSALLAAGAQEFVGKDWLTPNSLTRALDSAIERHTLTRTLRRQELEARRLEQKLQQTQKLESLGVLAGGIAHDFNNLLVGVLGNAEMALAVLPGDSPARTELHAIEAAALRATELTRQLLAYAGKARFSRGRMDLRRLIEEMGPLLGSAIPKKTQLTFDLAPALPAVDGDPTQIRQVVMNLVTNAAEAMGDAPGVITVRVAAVRVTRGDRFDAYFSDDFSEGPFVLLEVIDGGSGMREETLARVFEPFFTTKFTGRGLGLAAVLGIVRAHRGGIHLRSAPGNGTTVSVLLPAFESKTSAEQPPAPPKRPAAGTVLVVDDEEIIRALMRRILERAGYQVLIARDGVEALEIYKARGDEIRAVTLDMTMPRMGGEETLQALRAVRPDVKVLLLSGYNAQEGVDGALAPAEVFLEKPFRSQALLDKLKLLLGAN